MDSFGTHGALAVGDDRYEIFRLSALESDFAVSRLPYSLKVLLENLLRHEGSPSVSAEDVAALARGAVDGQPREIAFSPARILLQDFTGVPAVADLAALRDAVAVLGGDPLGVNPAVPAELVIDHSVVVDAYGTRGAFARNVELEFARNQERYRFLRWGQQALSGLRVAPPGRGICHQVNLEYLARVVFVDGAGVAYPDTLLGTDSHTPMVNGLGVLGWGVGGIEAEAAMLGQPSTMLVPRVVGFRLIGALPEGTTATDLVLTVTEMLRRHGVVGRFVEFYGPGVANVSVENRATIGNMSPEYGSSVTMFPIDEETLRYLTFTGRPPAVVQLVEAYAKEQGLWHDPGARPVFSETFELDLSTVVASIAGPARPQDRVALDRAKATFRAVLPASLPESPQPDDPSGLEGLPLQVAPGSVEAASAASFPASDPPTAIAADADPDDSSAGAVATEGMPDRPRVAVLVRLRGGAGFELDHGHVVIAAITSCTNTSNPSVMLAAGLLAKKAVELGVQVKPWVKTSLAPGSRVVVDYYERAGLLPFLEELGFHVVGFGCTTCIGNSGPLAPEVSSAIAAGGVAVASVLSGNRNFEGRIHPEVRLNYLMSPPLVVAYALAGTIDVDLRHEPMGAGRDGRPVYLRDLWPTGAEVEATVTMALSPDMFGRAYADVFGGDERWEGLDVPTGDRYSWEPASTYVRKPPFLDGLTRRPDPVADITAARVLAVLGDGTTTDHISPAGAIRAAGPAGDWLTAHGVRPEDFSSYGARRGNDEVMIRGTFANVRLRNRLAPGTEGGVTVHLPDGEPMTIYDAAVRYRQEGVPLVVLAGTQYGSGSSRDWAAKGTVLLGVRAVLAESFERIHRSNLLQMGVLPLQFRPGESVEGLGLSGREAYTIMGLGGARLPRDVRVRADGLEFSATVRIDTPMEAEYYRHGGILPYVARSLVP